MAEMAGGSVTVAVASSLLAPLIGRRASKLGILGVSRDLTWLSLDGTAFTIQSVQPDSKLALPTSIFFQREQPCVEEVSLHDGQLWLDGAPLQITRWWHPPRAPRVPMATWNGAFGLLPDIEALLGRGLGLTPEGDDLVAGWLVMARSIGHPKFAAIRAEVLEASATRTTSFSSALLECAGEGYGVAPLIDYVTSHLDGRNDISIARARLVEVGHTSGQALAMGVDMAFGLVDKRIGFTKFNVQERAIAS